MSDRDDAIREVGEALEMSGEKIFEPAAFKKALGPETLPEEQRRFLVGTTDRLRPLAAAFVRLENYRAAKELVDTLTDVVRFTRDHTERGRSSYAIDAYNQWASAVTTNLQLLVEGL